MSIASYISNTFVALTNRAAISTVSHGPDVSSAPPDTRRLIRNRQYCRVLSKQANVPFDEVSLNCAYRMFVHEMAFVPAGEVRLACDCVVTSRYGLEIVSTPSEPIQIDPIYMDRNCVTNADFAKFVKAGGYENANLWPESILANVLQFVDRTGIAGPRLWSGGQPQRETLDHPVVGVSWYEASAYAAWCGKRLPTSEEWQRAGTWFGTSGNSNAEMRYPWGNAFDPLKANTWACGTGHTVPVDAFADGDTPNGIRQLVGNVWEWIDAQFQPIAQEGTSVLLDESMAEVRGGAFDTYFHTHATSQFRTGQPLLSRSSNVGFRCCISEAAISEPRHVTAESEPGPISQEQS